MKKSLFFVVLLLLLGRLHAQNFTWTPFFPNVLIADIAADCDNTYITGTFSGTVQIGTFTLVSQGSSDAFLAKIDAQHQVAWAKQIGPTGNSKSGTHLAVNSKGEVVVSGTFSSQPFLCKHDGQSNLMVLKVYSQNTGASLSFSDLAISAADEVVVAGSYFGFAQLGNVQLDSMGKRDAFIAKLTPDLEQVLWANDEFSTDGQDFSDGLALDADGNVYVSGAKSQILTPICFGYYGRVFLAKLNSQDGQNIWYKESDGGSGNTTRHFIEVDKEGKYCYFTGCYKSGMQWDGIPILTGNDCDYHLYVGKMDAQTGGVFWWDDCSTGDFYPQESALGTDGTIYLGGYYTLYSDPVAQVCGDTLSTQFLANGFIAGFEPDQGQLTSMKVLNAPTSFSSESVRGVFVGENGALSICGNAGANAYLDDQPLNATSAGGFIAQTDPAKPCGDIPGPVIFDIGETQGITNSTVKVPVYVRNFLDVTSIGFTVQVDNTAVASIVGQTDYGLAGLTDMEFNILNNGKHLLFSWVSPDGLGKTLPDSTVIFNILIKINGTDSVCTNLSITGAPLAVEVTQEPVITPAPYLLFNGEVCVKTRGDIRGMILTEDSDPVKDVTVTAQGSVSGQFVTGPDGTYSITQLPLGYPYDIEPVKDINPTNGVTAFDLARINQHILQIASLDSPYKWIAADASKDDKITPMDILILKQLILGIITNFPSNTSWRFVPENYVFQNPNPFLAGFPEIIELLNLTDDFFNGDFVGIKIGDVDLDADGQVKPAQNQPALTFALLSKNTRANGILTVPFRASDFEKIAAFQFGMQFDPRLLEFAGVIPGALPIGNESVFAADGKLGLVWFDPSGGREGLTFRGGEVLFSLQFKAIGQAAISVRDLKPESDHIQSVAFKSDGMPMQIRWSHIETQAALPETSGNVFSSDVTVFPNPFSNSATISFSTDAESEVVKTLLDINGRVIYQVRETLQKGTQEWIIRETDLPIAPGTLFYQIEVNGETRRGTLIKI